MNSPQTQTMDFFGAQDRAKTNTFKLVILFMLALAALCIGMFVIINTVYVYGSKEEGAQATVQDFLNWDILAFSVLGTMGLVGCATLFKVASLSGGGEKVASMLGGRKINPSTTNLEERKVLNVVEEMAIASGVPTPDVYMMPEDSINAFAAGTKIENAVIGVTRGCVKLLTRDELQGVIAHEFSHILNLDMKLNIKLMGGVFGIMVIAIIGRYMMEIAARSGRGSSKDNKGAFGFILVGLGIFILGSAGLFFSRWIKSAISRQREYLADASAVQFTRNPAGIAGALKKIGGLHHGSAITAPNAEEASHMFFGNCLKSSFMFATHPPLEDRIKRIDPGFNGQFQPISPKDVVRDEPTRSQARAAAKSKSPIPIPGLPNIPGGENIPLPGGAVIGAAILEEEEKRRLAHAAVSADQTVGNPGKLQLDYASDLIHQLPDQLADDLHHPMTAMATILALLLDSQNDKIRLTQLQILDSNGPKGLRREVERIHPSVVTLGHQFLLPLAELSAPALRDLSHQQYVDFKKLCHLLIEADQSIDLFEYTLDKMLESSLDEFFGLTKNQSVQIYSPNGVIPEIENVLACLAHHGNSELTDAQKAYEAGIQSIFDFRSTRKSLPEKSHCGLSQLNEAMQRIRQCSAPVKKQIIQAVGKTIAADGMITRIESEMMRSLCYGFGCPVPPFVG